MLCYIRVIPPIVLGHIGESLPIMLGHTRGILPAMLCYTIAPLYPLQYYSVYKRRTDIEGAAKQTVDNPKPPTLNPENLNPRSPKPWTLTRSLNP